MLVMSSGMSLGGVDDVALRHGKGVVILCTER